MLAHTQFLYMLHIREGRDLSLLDDGLLNEAHRQLKTFQAETAEAEISTLLHGQVGI